MNPLIPGPDPFGLPAPAWLLVLLMLVTQVLHFLFMNFVLGGSWILVWLAAGREQPWKACLYQRMMNVLPVALSLAITFGIAPLLFVQVLYGHFFYPANVLMSWFWLSILGLLIGAFYGVYLLKWKKESLTEDLIPSTAVRVVLHLAAALAFTGVAFLLTTNAVLTIQPDRWEAARTGLAPISVWGEITYILPRFLHSLIGAFALAGLWVLWIANHPGSVQPDKGGRLGAWVAVSATVIGIALGLWYLMSLPQETIRAMMSFGNLASWGFMAGTLLSVGLFLSLVFLLMLPTHAILRSIASLLAAITLLAMVATSEGIRELLLAEHFTLAQWQVNTQYGPLGLFLILFVGGVGVVGWMALVVWKAYHSESHSR